MSATPPTPATPRPILSQEQQDHFRVQGYLSLGKVLEDGLLEELRVEYDRIFAAAQGAGTFRNLSGPQDGPATAAGPGGEQMLQIMQMCERSLLFRRLLYHEALLEVAQDLIGPNIQLFHDQALFKPAHHGGAVLWHQDNAYWKCAPANLVSCWLTLDAVDASNGAMHLIPGSHLRPVAHPRSASTVLLDIGQEVDASEAVVVDLPAGGAMVHHCQTVHYTPPNRTDRQRRAFVIHWMPPGTWSGHRNDYIPVSFGNPMLRMRV